MGELRISKDDILKALGTVEEPDLKQDLVSLGMIQYLELGIGEVRFTVVLTTPACPLKEVIRKRCETAIHSQVDANLKIIIDFTANVTTNRHNAPLLPGVKNIIAVSSGKGGVGKSTVTSNLAIALHKAGAKVGIIDADISGPSIPIMFGAEGLSPEVIPSENGKNLMRPIQQWGIKLMSIGFFTPPDSATVWRGPMASQALRQFFGDVAWGELDYLLIDLPPGTSDIHLTLVQSVPVTGAVVVTTPQAVALADATKGLAMFRQPQINVPVLGIIENMAYFTPAELPSNKYYIFGKDGGKMLAQKYEVALLGQIPIVQSIRESADEGKPAFLNADAAVIEAFKQTAEALAQQVAIRNASQVSTKIVEIKA